MKTIGFLIGAVGFVMFVSGVFAGCGGCAEMSVGMLHYSIYAGPIGFGIMLLGGFIYVLGGGEV